MIGGVCGGIGRYFGIDPTLVRIGFVALALLGGTGLDRLRRRAAARPARRRGRADRPRHRAIAALALGLLDRARRRRRSALGGFGLGFGGALVPLGFLALAGLAVWWLVSGERPSGSPGDVVRRAALGVGLLIGCFALAVGELLRQRPRRRRRRRGASSSPPAPASSPPPSSAARAGSCCRRWRSRCRWRSSRPPASTSTAASASATSAPARSPRSSTSYRLGAGELVIDLRDVDLPAGDHPLKVRHRRGPRAGARRPRTSASPARPTIGMGARRDLRPRQRRHRRRLERHAPRAARTRRGSSLDGDVGLGLLEVSHTRDTIHQRPATGATDRDRRRAQQRLRSRR